MNPQGGRPLAWEGGHRVTAAGPFSEAEPEHQDCREQYPNGYTCPFPRWVLPNRSDGEDALDTMHGESRTRGTTMETAKARELLRSERLGVQQLIQQMAARGRDDRTAADQSGDMFDSAQPLTEQGTDDAVLAGLEERLAAIDRAEKRLDAGTYGYSVRSGVPISDERLEVDPAAELTVEEASEAN